MKKYVVISLKHSRKDELVFWRENDAGYTSNPFKAGIYSEEQIKNGYSYYNDGDNVAVPIDDKSFAEAGIKVTFNKTKLLKYADNRNYKKQ